MTPISHVAVIVPAADEQERIGACLEALSRACDRLSAQRPGVISEIVVVLDDCADLTEDIVGDYRAVAAVAIASRCVGVARDVGTRIALSRTMVSPERVLTLHTDADSTVPSGWLLDFLRHAETGADLILGSVEPALEGSSLARWRMAHRTDAGHPNVHGANLGIRGDVLLSLGGWPHLTTGEDVRLAVLAEAAGARIVRAGELTVTTSARTLARAPKGFSRYLREWDEPPEARPLAVG